VAVSTALDAVRLGSSEVAALYLGSDSVWTANAPGMVLLTDYTITHAGTSATLTNGQVTFTAVTSLSLNGVFTAGFDNYVVVLGCAASASDINVAVRLRASGSDNSTASSYTRQILYADSTTIFSSRASADLGGAYAHASSTSRNISVGHFYGPFLAQPTAVRTVIASGYASAYIQDVAITHNQSTSYDGFTLIPGSTTNITGSLQVYGVRS
jgi:hypothetical protein